MRGHLERPSWLRAGANHKRVRLPVVRWAKPNHIQGTAVVRMVRLRVASADKARQGRDLPEPNGQVKSCYGGVAVRMLSTVSSLLFGTLRPHLDAETTLLDSLALKVLLELLRPTFHGRGTRASFTAWRSRSGNRRVRIEVGQWLGFAAASAGLARRIVSAHAARSSRTMVWEVTPRACQLGALRLFSQNTVSASSVAHRSAAC